MKKVVIIAIDAKEQNELIDHISDKYGNEFRSNIVTDSYIKDSIGFKITEDGQLPRAIEENINMLIDVYEDIIYDQGEGLYEFYKENGKEGLFHIEHSLDAVNYMIALLHKKSNLLRQRNLN